MTGIQLLRSILRELGLSDRGNDRVRLTAAPQRLPARSVPPPAADVVLLIDEAQDLSHDLLEEVRLLSNLETDDRKLLQIVLVGQPELRAKLDRTELRQLRQRITVRYHLGPLTAPRPSLHPAPPRPSPGPTAGRPSPRGALRSIHHRSGVMGTN